MNRPVRERGLNILAYYGTFARWWLPATDPLVHCRFLPKAKDVATHAIDMANSIPSRRPITCPDAKYPIGASTMNIRARI